MKNKIKSMVVPGFIEVSESRKKKLLNKVKRTTVKSSSLKKKDVPSLCLRCANVFKAKHNSKIACPKCKFTMSRDEYNKIHKAALESFHFGFTYRKYYERQRGDIHTKPSIAPPSGPIEELAMILYSGVIGGAAFELVKYIVKEALSKYKVELPELKECFKYVKQYYKKSPKIDPKIQALINEELHTDYMSQEFVKLLMESKNPKSMSEIASISAEAARRAFKKLRESTDSKNKLALPVKPFSLIEKANAKKRTVKKGGKQWK